MSPPHSPNTVFLIGGRYGSDNRETLGAMAIAQLDLFRADRAVLTVAAIDADGVMDADFEEAQVARAMIDRARHTIVVADGSKFERTAAFKVCDLGDIDMLISDREPSPELAEALTRSKVELA
jgi:DeoR family transcriptional regulator, glycerol-3-phosphate regulon repressor